MLRELDLSKFWMHTESSSANVNDVIFFGGSKVMDVVCSLYAYFNEYYQQGIIVFGENILRHHLQAKHIQTQRIYIPYFIRFASYNIPDIEHESFRSE